LKQENMKKVLIIFCMMLFMGEVYAQQQVSDTLRFMNDYRKFVSFVVSQPSLTKPVADSLIARQDTLMHQYRSLKPRLNDLQVEEYNRLKGRYTKKMLEYRGDRFTDGLEATGDSISKAAGRAGKAVGGFFKGLFE
jgi:hypothetical protein